MKNIFRLSAMILTLVGCGAIAEAQQPAKVPRIAILWPDSAPSPRIEAFLQGLRELGYVEGQNIAIEYRFAEGKRDRLPDLAADLVRLKVDVIVALTTIAARPAKNATRTIPIVMVSGDPIGTGLIASLARPGGNITGLSGLVPELGGKRLELLKEVIPGISRVAVLWDLEGPAKRLEFKEIEAVGAAFGVQIQSLEVRAPNPDFEGAFQAATKGRAGALITLGNPLTLAHITRIVDLAEKSRLPSMYDSTQFVQAGGLISYGPSLSDMFRRAATYVDRILKGAKPADLPVQQPMKFEFVINLKTAKQIGLTIPPNVLARADKVIR